MTSALSQSSSKVLDSLHRAGRRKDARSEKDGNGKPTRGHATRADESRVGDSTRRLARLRETTGGGGALTRRSSWRARTRSHGRRGACARPCPGCLWRRDGGATVVSACFVSARGRVTREPRRCRWTRTRSETARLGRDDARHARSATRTRDFSKPEPCRDRVIRVLASRARLGGRNDRPVVRRRARGFSRAESVENRETDAGRLRAVPGSAMGCLPERRAEMRAGRATPEMQEIAAILKTVVCVFMPAFEARGTGESDRERLAHLLPKRIRVPEA